MHMQEELAQLVLINYKGFFDLDKFNNKSWFKIWWSQNYNEKR